MLKLPLYMLTGALLFSASADELTLFPTGDATFGDAMTASYSTTVNKPECDTLTVCNYTCWGAPKRKMARAAMQFNFEALPSGSEVSSATLKLFKVGHYSDAVQDGSKPATYYIYPITSDWDEESVSWEGWNSTGGDYESEQIDSFTYEGEQTGWFTFDATSFVQDVISGTRENYGILLYVPGGDDEGGESMDQESWFHSSESSVDSLRPQLHVTLQGTNLQNEFGYNTQSTIKQNGTELMLTLKSAGNLTIYTMKGQQLLQKCLPAGEHLLPTSALSKSIYLMTLTYSNGATESSLLNQNSQ